MGFGREHLRDIALSALEEAASDGKAGPPRRTVALRFALAYLWSISGSERAAFDWFWKSLATENDIGRSQNINAALNGIYLALGLVRG